MDATTLVSAADTFVLLRWGVRAAGMVASVAAGAAAGAIVMRFHPDYYRSQRDALLAFAAVFLLGMVGVFQIDDDALMRGAIGADRATVCVGAAALLVRDNQPEVLRAMNRFGCNGGELLKASEARIAELVAKAGKDYADELELRRIKATKARYQALLMTNERPLPDDLDALLALEAQATRHPDPVWTVPLEFALVEVGTLVRPDSLAVDGVAAAAQRIGGRVAAHASLSATTARSVPYVARRAVPTAHTCAEAGDPPGCAVVGGEVYAIAAQASFAPRVDEEGRVEVDWDVTAYPKAGGTIGASGATAPPDGTVAVVPLDGGPLDGRLVLLLRAGKPFQSGGTAAR